MVTVRCEDGKLQAANAQDANDATPLHLASDQACRRSMDEEYLAVALLPIQYGSDIRARDDRGWTPFTRAEANQIVLPHHLAPSPDPVEMETFQPPY